MQDALLAPVVAEIAVQNAGKATICKLDVDNAQETAARYGITSIPSVLFFAVAGLVLYIVISAYSGYIGNLNHLMEGM